MKHLVLLSALSALLGAIAAPVHAQDAIPDLRGTWTGKGMAVIFGNNPHHPGSQTSADAPRVHEIEVTHVVEGQDGRLAWGHSSLTTADTKEPFAWAISVDNEFVVGADPDGYFQITVISADQMEKCYMQNGNGATHAIVATCYLMNRVKQ